MLKQLMGIGILLMVLILPKQISNNINAVKPQSIVVLELFTSQGCSSCPSADRLLNRVKDEFPNEVYALSYHVDYWNYLGWKDPFSNRTHTERQKKYNRKFNHSSIYTPQIVINGREHFVGSKKGLMYSKIKQYRAKKPLNNIELGNLHQQGKKVQFKYVIQGEIVNKYLKVVLVLSERITSINRGENRNRVLTNSNIVVAEKMVELYKNNGEATISIPKIVNEKENISVMTFVIAKNLDIDGAAKLNVQ